jgi:hypothetical protein
MIDDIFKNMMIDCLKPYEPNRIGIFASYARGEQQPVSDLDILIKFNLKISLLK